MSSTGQQGSKTPGQMLKIGSSVVIVPIVVLIFLIKMNLGSGGTDRASMAPEMVLSRIAPVALYNTGAPLPEPKDAVPLTGEQVYNRLCMTCHDTGVTDAPIKGNADQWAPRIAQGADTLFKHSLEGFNAMPAKGGDASLSDEEVKNAVVFMVNASGGNISVGESGGDAAASEPAPTEEAPAAEEVAPVEEATPAPEAVEEEPVAAEPADEVTAEEAVEETTSEEAAEVPATKETPVAPAEEEVAETEVGDAVETVEEVVTEEITELTETVAEAVEEATETTEEVTQLETAPTTEVAPVEIESTPTEIEVETPEVEAPETPETEEVPLNQQEPAQESK